MVGWRSMGEEWTALARRRGAGSLALMALCLAVYLPGFIRLPAVDRTEVIWAETTRDMVARGDWTDPRYGDQVHQYRPIGTFWAQGAARVIAGDTFDRDIRVYRLPSLISVVLAVLAVYWLGSALVGRETALIAAALFAVSPLTVLLSQLAIAESLSILPATVAMLALLRLYALGDDNARLKETAALFWLATGIGVLINALLVPILVIATLIALVAMDRNLSWLRRLYPVLGLPVALAIAWPWIWVRVHQDGTAFAGMNWHDFLGALGGAQDMKLRAFPGTFLLALVLGFLPGTVLLGSAALQLWSEREQKLARFLIAWIAGYLVYLEALSSKPGTYMVQTMFPALALAVACVVVRETADHRPPKGHGFIWPTAFSILPFAIFAAVYAFARQWPSVVEAALIIVIAGLFILSGQQGAEGRLRRWAVTGVTALGLLAITLLGLAFPSIVKIWPSRQLTELADACPGRQIDLLGFREPSARFLLRSDTERQTPDAVAAGLTGDKPSLTIIEDRWNQRAAAALNAKTGKGMPTAHHCVTAYNVMRGCRLRFRVYLSNAGGPCTLPEKFTCDDAATPAQQEKSRNCD